MGFSMLKIKHREDYRKLRKAEYPALAEQLDMLWHAMNTGQIVKSEPFYSKIKAIKDRFPKGV
jgi:hypothetical protein